MCSPCVCFHIPLCSLCLDHTEMSTTDFLSELGRPNSKVVCLSHCAGTLMHTYPDRPSPASAGTLTSCPTRPMEPSQIPCDSMIFLYQSFDVIQKNPSVTWLSSYLKTTNMWLLSKAFSFHFKHRWFLQLFLLETWLRIFHMWVALLWEFPFSTVSLKM